MCTAPIWFRRCEYVKEITLWYHSHPHGQNTLHVFRVFAGSIIVDDETSEAALLPHTYGVDDIPRIIQDRSIDPEGQIEFSTADNATSDIVSRNASSTLVRRKASTSQTY